MGPFLIHLHNAAVVRDEQLRVADERRRVKAGMPPERVGGRVDAHERQRTLVRASLLLSRRRDPATHRRSA